jgi:hypothetical protein
MKVGDKLQILLIVEIGSFSHENVRLLRKSGRTEVLHFVIPRDELLIRPLYVNLDLDSS